MTPKDLNKKPWYRLLKVLFFFALFIALLFALTVAWVDGIPEKTINHTQSVVLCDDGTRHTLQELNISLSTTFPIIFSDSSEDGRARSRCEGFSLDVSAFNTFPKNYTVEFAYDNVGIGEWARFIAAILLLITGILLTAEIIKRAFYYVVLGKMFFKKEI